jgi:hypothetical protein
MINAAACWVFTAFFGGIALILTWSQRPELMRELFPPPAWFPWVLGGVFLVKVCVALILAGTAWKEKRVSGRAICSYTTFWLSVTALLLVLTWLLFPLSTDSRCIAMLAVLFLMPMARVAVATLVRAGPL